MKRYSTGEPCPNGHMAERYISTKQCIICAAERVREWRKLNTNKILAYNEQWRASNPEKAKASHRKACRAYDERNHDAVLQAKKDWFKNNPEYMTAFQRKWREANPDKFLAITHNSIAKRLGAVGRLHAYDIQHWRDLQGGRCYWCCKLMEKEWLEHLMPLTKGGENTRENIRLSCSHCNQSKNNQLPLDFAISLLSHAQV